MKQIIFASILFLFFSFSGFAQNENSLCPKIEVVGGGVVNTGDSMTFTVNVSDETKNLILEYEWKVSSGTIANGQGTPSITVNTTGLSGQNIEAAVKVKGLSANCANTASEKGEVHTTGDPRQLDEFGKISTGGVKARIDALFIELGSNPKAQGYIINYGTNKEIIFREKQIQKVITFRKYDANRVKLMRGGKNPNQKGVLTKVWIVLSDV
jgi:PKD-like domain